MKKKKFYSIFEEENLNSIKDFDINKEIDEKDIKNDGSDELKFDDLRLDNNLPELDSSVEEAYNNSIKFNKKFRNLSESIPYDEKLYKKLVTQQGKDAADAAFYKYKYEDLKLDNKFRNDEALNYKRFKKSHPLEKRTKLDYDIYNKDYEKRLGEHLNDRDRLMYSSLTPKDNMPVPHDMTDEMSSDRPGPVGMRIGKAVEGDRPGPYGSKTYTDNMPNPHNKEYTDTTPVPQDAHGVQNVGVPGAGHTAQYDYSNNSPISGDRPGPVGMHVGNAVEGDIPGPRGVTPPKDTHPIPPGWQNDVASDGSENNVGAFKTLGDTIKNHWKNASGAISTWVKDNPNLTLGLGAGAAALGAYALWNRYKRKKLENKLINKSLNASFEYPYYDLRNYSGLNEKYTLANPEMRDNLLTAFDFGGNESNIPMDYALPVGLGVFGAMTIHSLIKYLLSRGKKKEAEELSDITNSVTDNNIPVSEGTVSTGSVTIDSQGLPIFKVETDNTGMNPALAGGLAGAASGALTSLTIYGLIKLLKKLNKNKEAEKVAEIANTADLRPSENLNASYNVYDKFANFIGLSEKNIADMLDDDNFDDSYVNGAGGTGPKHVPKVTREPANLGDTDELIGAASGVNIGKYDSDPIVNRRSTPSKTGPTYSRAALSTPKPTPDNKKQNVQTTDTKSKSDDGVKKIGGKTYLPPKNITRPKQQTDTKDKNNEQTIYSDGRRQYIIQNGNLVRTNGIRHGALSWLSGLFGRGKKWADSRLGLGEAVEYVLYEYDRLMNSKVITESYDYHPAVLEKYNEDLCNLKIYMDEVLTEAFNDPELPYEVRDEMNHHLGMDFDDKFAGCDFGPEVREKWNSYVAEPKCASNFDRVDVIRDKCCLLNDHKLAMRICAVATAATLYFMWKKFSEHHLGMRPCEDNKMLSNVLFITGGLPNKLECCKESEDIMNNKRLMSDINSLVENEYSVMSLVMNDFSVPTIIKNTISEELDITKYITVGTKNISENTNNVSMKKKILF